ncbi:MAG: glycosyltransferase family 39 protein [Candidatus Buchananbacteria bacterium]
MSKPKILWEPIILLGIIAAAAVVRLIALFNFGTYTFDDIFSVHFASFDLNQMFSLLKDEVHPSAYYLLLHFWLKFFSENEIIAKLPSLFFSLGAILVLYSLTKKILNRQTAFVAAIIFAFSYFQIFIACQARMYPMLEFTGLLSLLLFWQIFIEKKKGLWLLYLLINLVTVLTHLGGLFALATQWLWLLILLWQKQIDKKETKKFLFAQLAVIGLWLIWFVPLFLPKLSTIINKGWYFSKNRRRNFAIGVYDFFFLLLKNYWLRFYSAVIILASPFLVLLWPDKKVNWQTPNKINPGWFLFAWLLPGLIVSIIIQINYIRIFAISYLALYLLVAYFFYLLWQQNKKTFWLITVCWFLITGFVLSQNLFLNFCRWDLANQWLLQNEKPGDKIIIYGYIYELPFKRYYTGQTPYVGLYPLQDSETLEQRIVKRNWQNLLDSQSVEKLQTLTFDANRIIVVYEVNPPDQYLFGPAHEWFTKNNWQIKDSYKPDAYCGPQIYIYQK